ncbi:MAG: hypothetical protein ACLR7U_00180 [Ruthenibacterium lactatiformans]
MTLGGQQTGALGGLWAVRHRAPLRHGKTGCAHHTLPYAGELLDKDNL